MLSMASTAAPQSSRVGSGSPRLFHYRGRLERVAPAEAHARKGLVAEMKGGAHESKLRAWWLMKTMHELSAALRMSSMVS